MGVKAKDSTMKASLAANTPRSFKTKAVVTCWEQSLSHETRLRLPEGRAVSLPSGLPGKRGAVSSSCTSSGSPNSAHCSLAKHIQHTLPRPPASP